MDELTAAITELKAARQRAIDALKAVLTEDNCEELLTEHYYTIHGVNLLVEKFEGGELTVEVGNENTVTKGEETQEDKFLSLLRVVYPCLISNGDVHASTCGDNYTYQIATEEEYKAAEASTKTPLEQVAEAAPERMGHVALKLWKEYCDHSDLDPSILEQYTKLLKLQDEEGCPLISWNTKFKAIEERRTAGDDSFEFYLWRRRQERSLVQIVAESLTPEEWHLHHRQIVAKMGKEHLPSLVPPKPE